MPFGITPPDRPPNPEPPAARNRAAGFSSRTGHKVLRPGRSLRFNPVSTIRMKPHRRMLCARLVAAGFLLSTALGNPVVEWHALMLDAIRTDTSNPPLASRHLAMLSTALFDCVNAVAPTHQSYLPSPEVPPGASAEAAVVAAGREMMRTLHPGFQGRIEALANRQRSVLGDAPGIPDGLALGRSVALRMLAARSADGSNTEVPYIPSSDPGQWRRTPPFFRPPLSPHWGRVTLFCLPGLDGYRAPPPPALGSPEYAVAFNEVKRLGGAASTARTPEQTVIAQFWSDFSYTAMPPGHWTEIASSIAVERRLDLAETARLLALVDLSQADAAIVCWDIKYRWNLWRPITAIQRADEDGNPGTEADPAWDQLLPSPPFPAYTSGHSTFSGAAAQVLTGFFGTDAVAFTAHSDTLTNVTRRFTSIASCADEVGLSRIYGGIHFPFDNSGGRRSGERIGRHVVRHYLLPLRSLPLLLPEEASSEPTRLRAHGPLGRPLRIERSLDRIHWTPQTRSLGLAGGVLVDADSGGYYRVVAGD